MASASDVNEDKQPTRIWQNKNPGPYGCQHVTEMYAEYIGMCDDCYRDRLLNDAMESDS